MKKPDRQTTPHRVRVIDRQDLAKITGGGDVGVDPSLAYKALGPKVGA